MKSSEEKNRELKFLYANEIGLFPASLEDVDINPKAPERNLEYRNKQMRTVFDAYTFPPRMDIFFRQDRNIKTFIYDPIRQKILQKDPHLLNVQIDNVIRRDKKQKLDMDDFMSAWIENVEETNTVQIVFERDIANLKTEVIELFYWVITDFIIRDIEFPTTWCIPYIPDNPLGHHTLYITYVRRPRKIPTMPFINCFSGKQNDPMIVKIYESTPWCHLDETYIISQIFNMNSNHRVYAAILDNQYVGFALVHMKTEAKWEVIILCANVNQSTFRIGSNMMAKIEYDAYNMGVNILVLDSVIKTVGFYKKMGFLYTNKILGYLVDKYTAQFQLEPKIRDIATYFDNIMPDLIKKYNVGLLNNKWKGVVPMEKYLNKPPKEWLEWNSKYLMPPSLD